MSQTVLPAEIWLIDDASQDGGRTPGALFELKQRYGDKTNIEVISLGKNSGPAVARNTGWDKAKQSYIAFLDADDAWHPRKLEIQYGWMKAHPHVALTGHPYAWLKENNPNLTIPAGWDAQQISPLHLLLSNRFSTPSVMLHSDLPYRFDSTKRHSEDYLLWLQIVLSGHPAWRLEIPMVYLYKAPFGERGVSADLWKMEKGELDTYWRLHRQGFITNLTVLALTFYSLLKYLRRLIMKLFDKTIS
jgi:glycosyltransferase involved in cell wall biosynthesis